MAGTLTATTIQNDTSSPPTFRNNSVEIGRLCRAWVNYNGSGQTIRDSFNVSSVTKNNTGDFTVNFTTAMPNANYSVVTGSKQNSDTAVNLTTINPTSYATASIRIICSNATQSAIDPVIFNVAIFSS